MGFFFFLSLLSRSVCVNKFFFGLGFCLGLIKRRSKLRVDLLIQ